MIVRPVEQSDADQIAAIYNPFIESSVITFEYDLIDGPEISRRIAKIVEGGFPYLVTEIDGQVVGYAYAGPWRERAAFKFTVETAVYLNPEFKGQGIGKRLYEDVLNLCREGGYRIAVAGITIPNPASQALHASCGFEKVAYFKSVGFKFEKWIDVEFWQLEL
jgi:phosphinothricin acetyltransferase